MQSVRCNSWQFRIGIRAGLLKEKISIFFPVICARKTVETKPPRHGVAISDMTAA